MCAVIKQAKRVKPLWYGGRWSKYKYGEAWQIDYITLPQTRQGKRCVLTMVEATTGWLETYPVPHATARNTILGLEKQILWSHSTPEKMESGNWTHFKNSPINSWAREHGIEWVYHSPYHAPAAGKVERCNGLLKTTLKAWGGGTFKNWEINLAKATWLVNTRGSTNQAGPAQSEPLRTRDGDKVPVVHMRGMLGKTVWINSASSKDNPAHGVVFAQGPGCTCPPWCCDAMRADMLPVVDGDVSYHANSVCELSGFLCSSRHGYLHVSSVHCGHADVCEASSWLQHFPLIAASMQSWMAAGSNVPSSNNMNTTALSCGGCPWTLQNSLALEPALYIFLNMGQYLPVLMLMCRPGYVLGDFRTQKKREPEIITRSLSLGELRDLRREFTRQTNESILTWLLRIWDAAANDTILDGSEARQLGSLSRDVVIDQGIGRTQQTLSLWRRLLTSVRDRYPCKEGLQVAIATATTHHWQYRTDRDSVIPIHEMIRKLESQGVVSKARSPFNSPIWPVRKSSGEWRLMVDYRALNEVMPPLSAAMPDMLELQYDLESKAAKWYVTIDIANAFFSIPLAAECRAQFAFTWKGVQYTWN
ncbi:hypothetical protein DUI87_05590 [Hirundo rustica rustica]|uniref:ribonuclease H n=1 Tax=Hirundo rustica rustica TaxID=333673 RepID=A0A3M0KYZ3_HIRRU|nr:hypothetical protein DUI87_05590 [Hirundo rustica rustica]